MSDCIACGNCKHARQIADKKRQDIVGCVLLNGNPNDSLGSPLLKMEDVRESNVYEGYVYFGRRVGDIEKSDTFGKGTLTLGLMVDETGYCPKYEER